MNTAPAAPTAAPYRVHLAERTLPFRWVEVLRSDLPAIEYRHGNSPVFYPIKMPGLGRVGNLVLHGFVLGGEDELGAIRELLAVGQAEQRAVRIDLLDAETGVGATWTLNNAWPTALTPMEEPASEGNIAYSLELSFERLAILAPEPR